MRATYACGEVSGTSSSTSISLTTAHAKSPWSSGTTRMPGRVRRRARPLDHHGNARGLEPAPQDLCLELRPLTQLDERVVAAAVVALAAPGERAGLRGDECNPAVDALQAAGPVLGAARRTPRRRTVAIWSLDARPDSRLGVSRERCSPDYDAGRPMPQALLRRDARLPEERRRLRQGRRILARRRARAAAGRRGRRPRRGQHVRVHRGGPPGVDRRRARAGRREARPAPSSCVTGCMAERYGDELAAALPEADAVVGFAGEGALAERRPEAQADRSPRPAGAAATRTVRAVGVREDRRRVRPRLRVLRDPVVPRHATVTDAGIDRDRSARAGRTRRAARSSSSRRTSRGTAATRTSPARSRRCCAGSTPCRLLVCTRIRLLYLYPSEVHDPLVSTMFELRHGRAVLRPLACSTRRRDCCAA